jgi:hypothetical protein
MDSKEETLVCNKCLTGFTNWDELTYGDECPFCEDGGYLVHYEDIDGYGYEQLSNDELMQEHQHMHDLFDKIEEDGTKDLSKPYFDFPHFPQPDKFYQQCNDRNDRQDSRKINYDNLPAQTLTLSFHDLDCQELALIDLSGKDLIWDNEKEYSVIKCMEIFQHTFLEENIL